MKIDIDKLNCPYLRDILSLFEEKTYFVGGFVRDILLKRKVKDVDIVGFDVPYFELANRIKNRLNGVAIRFKDNVRIVLKDFVIDVSKPRGKSLEEDLSKRDFTINNLALDKYGNLIGNTEDLDNRIIRHVYPEVFQDDSVRILRAFRFVSQLGFSFARETFVKIINEKELLKEAPLERVFDELVKLFEGDYSFNALLDLQKTEVLFALFPEFKKIEGLPQGKYHKDCALTHTFRVVSQVNFMAKKLFEEREKQTVLLLTALFHDVGKGFTGPKNNYRNFVGHEEESEKIAKKYLYSFPLKRKLADKILKIIRNHSKIRIYATEGARDITLKKFVYENRDILEELIVFTLADNLTKGRSMDKLYSTIMKIREITRELNWENENLINGYDLMNIGVLDKRKYSKILDEVKRKLVFGELGNKEDAINFIRKTYLQ